MKILIADDSELIRERVRADLNALPFDVVIEEANTIEKALATCRSVEPEVIILNFSMPGGRGLTTLGSLKAMPHPPIVIILTNFSTPEYKQVFFQAGAHYFFDKSLEFEQVGKTICHIKAQQTSSPPELP